MADNTPARKSRRPPRGGRSLGAIRKGVEGNATTATARSGTREPLLNKQTPAYNDDWDEDVRFNQLTCDRESFSQNPAILNIDVHCVSIFSSGLGRLSLGRQRS